MAKNLASGKNILLFLCESKRRNAGREEGKKHITWICSREGHLRTSLLFLSFLYFLLSPFCSWNSSLLFLSPLLWIRKLFRNLQPLHQKALSVTNWHLPGALAFYLQEDWILCYCSCWPSASKESSWRRAEMRHSAEGEGAGGTARSSGRYFQELILWAQFLYLSKQALNSFMVTSVPHD